MNGPFPDNFLFYALLPVYLSTLNDMVEHHFYMPVRVCVCVFPDMFAFERINHTGSAADIGRGDGWGVVATIKSGTSFPADLSLSNCSLA